MSEMQMTDRNQSFTIITTLLKGIGHIMLQNNSWTGLFFLVGICCGSLMLGLAAVIAVIAGTFTAMLLRYDNDEINNGLYGFSAVLVGVALICFFRPTIVIWAAILIGSALATVIQPARTNISVCISYLAHHSYKNDKTKRFS